MFSKTILRQLAIIIVLLGLLFSSTGQIKSLAARGGEQLPVNSDPLITDADQTISAGSEYAQNIRDGKYPFQLVSSTGNIRLDQHGPQRNDPAEGIPVHAYSPFDERNNREYPCPPGGCDFMAGQVLIKFAPEVTANSSALKGQWTGEQLLDQALAAQGVQRLEQMFPLAQAPRRGETVTNLEGQVVPKPDLTRWYRAGLAAESDVNTAVEALSKMPGVVWAEPDFLRKPVGIFEPSNLPNPQSSTLNLPGPGTDPLYAQQWHLGAANIPAAWAYLESQSLPPGGSHDIVVAVIDTGVDYTHPDLAANIWVNPAEFYGTPGVDDDHNGYVDDIHGADTVTPDGNPQDDHGHGTHVAGIIAAQADNGIGGVGVAYNVQIMPIKAAQYSGVLASSDIAEAIYYAVEKGADVINMSFGGYARSQVEEDALAVAFGQAVLVAAAGNDRFPNERPCVPVHPMYPASYNWVLGVMASSQGGGRASFSNYDCKPHTVFEYELMAPGVDVWSTLPNGQYAAWDGTSMAAPVVSGIAALLRTYYTNRDLYSSRFIMGQIAANVSGGIGGEADAYAALTVSPQPELSYLQHWLFDTTSQSASNDNDGIVDSGETVDLAIVIRNHWGKADPVTVTLEAWADGAVFPDPYVTMITDTVSYGAIGSFNQDDNGLIYDAEGAITGVEFPFRFTVPITTPNDHMIPFLLTMTAGNGYNLEDPSAPYTFISRFYLIAQRGVELPRIISEDMILTKDYYWLLPDATLIEPGVTVTVTEGTQVQFWSADPSDPYGINNHAYIQVEGNLHVQGSADEPIEFFSGKFYPGWAVDIRQKTGGEVGLNYVRIMNPRLSGESSDEYISLMDHSYLAVEYANCVYYRPPGWTNPQCASPFFKVNLVSNSIFHKVTNTSLYGVYQTDLFDSCSLGHSERYKDSVFLKNYLQVGNNYMVSTAQGLDSSTFNYVVRNAFLNVWWDPNRSHWMIFDVAASRGYLRYINDNFWGTTSTTLIDAAIRDYNDDFNKGIYVYQPILTVPASTTYPFVTDVTLSSALDHDVSVVSAEPITFTVAFNRDMDAAIQPAVSFGPDMPMTDYTIYPVNGGWQDPRTWAGVFNITPITGDGYQLIRVAGAVAADDPWLVTGDDAGRFRFEIITSGSSAMNLQATGGEGYVDLMWTQTDFEMLSGFNLYRSTSQDGTYSRINTAIIPPDVRDWRDTNVTPGQPYYYKFTVIKSDMTESDFSNVASATPIDTILPVINHTPETSALPGMPLTLFADVTDNVGVQSVVLYYRHSGDTTYSSRTMAHTTGNRYSATMEGSLLVSPGIEYYIEASDGVSVVRHGRPEYPHQVTVVDQPVVTGATPNHGPSTGGTAVTLSGSNFKPGATVAFGGAACSNVFVVSSSQITCNTPPHFPESVDVTVTNPDSQSGTLLHGYTYESDSASMGLPYTGGEQHSIVLVPINLANVDGLAAASLTVTFDESVLDALGVTTGSLTPGWSIVANTNIPGQVRISMISTGGTVSGSGALAYVRFDVVGSPGATTSLGLANVLLNDGAIPVEITSGSFMVDLVYALSGTVHFWNGGVVSGTLLSLAGDRLYTAQSNAAGAYTLSSLASDDYILAPSKLDLVNGISAYDASLVMQHDVGLIALTGYAATAADVNKNGHITSMDAYYILQKAVGLITLPFPGAGVVWDFNPPSRSYTALSSDLTGQDFTAILLGDPSGNWSPSGELMATTIFKAETTTATLSLPQVNVLPGELITVPLALNLPEGALYSADIIVTYDPTVVSALRVNRGMLASDWMLFSNLSTPGVIRIAMAGAVSITNSGELLLLTFQAVGASGTQTSLDLTRGSLNESGIPCNLQDGSLYIAVPVAAGFTGAPTSGPAPLNVVFTNTTTGDYTTSLWDFGDGSTSTLQNPMHIYNVAGVYTVTLAVNGPGGSDIETKTDYIHISFLEIGGIVNYWNGGLVIPGTLLSLTGDHVYSATSNEAGEYAINSVLKGNYVLTPSKLNDVNGISAYDASLALQHAAELITLTGHQATAADVNKSGAVTSLDASYILQYAVGLISLPFPGAGVIWDFFPASRTYVDLSNNQTNQDFTAILFGDPSGSWLSTPIVQAQADLLGNNAIVHLEAGMPDENNVVKATMWLDPASADVYSLDVVLSYDAAQVSIIGIDKNPALGDWAYASNLSQPGQIRLAIAGASAVTQPAAILTISFDLSNATQPTPLQFTLSRLNEGSIPANWLGTILMKWENKMYLPIIVKK